MCQTSNIKNSTENSMNMPPEHSNIERNGTCKKPVTSKLQGSETLMQQKIRKMDSSESQLNISSQKSSNNTSSSQTKLYHQTDHQDSESKANKPPSRNNQDNKIGLSNMALNKRAKGEGGNISIRAYLN